MSEPKLTPTVAPTLPSSRSTAQKVLGIVLAVVVAGGTAFGVYSILRVVAPKTPSVEQSDPYRYENTDYGFAVEFPGEPTERVDHESSLGLDLEVLQVQWTSGPDVLIVQAVDFPPELADQDAQTVLVDSLAGVSSSSGAVLSGERSSELDGAPARAATLTFENGDTAQILVALDGALQLMMMGSGDLSIDRLIATFEFTR